MVKDDVKNERIVFWSLFFTLFDILGPSVEAAARLGMVISKGSGGDLQKQDDIIRMVDRRLASPTGSISIKRKHGLMTVPGRFAPVWNPRILSSPRQDPYL
jgi:hypothetical protein